jgi:hypothetical protein
MKNLTLNHLKTDAAWTSNFLGKKATIQDYETNQGVVREYCIDGRKPRYAIVNKMLREPVKVNIV